MMEDSRSGAPPALDTRVKPKKRVTHAGGGARPRVARARARCAGEDASLAGSWAGTAPPAHRRPRSDGARRALRRLLRQGFADVHRGGAGGRR